MLRAGHGRRARKARPPRRLAARRTLTVERIYSAPSLSGRRPSRHRLEPRRKWLTYLERRDRSGRPANLGRGRRTPAAPRARGRPAPAQHPAAARLARPADGPGPPHAAAILWSPDSKALLFISAQELFWYDLADANLANARRCAAICREAAPAAGRNGRHDRRRQDFARRPLGQLPAHHDIWVVSVAGGQPRQITRGGTRRRRNGELDWVYPEELDLHTAYWWSPDSSQIAFLQLDESHVEKYPLVDELSLRGRRHRGALPRRRLARIPWRASAWSPSTGGDVRWMDTGPTRARCWRASPGCGIPAAWPSSA